jgi:hypothetical protein
VNLSHHSENSLAPREIRRYPTELDRMTVRDGAKHAEGSRRSPTFSQVAAGVNGGNRIDTTSTEPAPAKTGKPFALWEKDGFGFADFLDIINPLQHIPIVATIYRNLSGDQIGAAPRVIGGGLWGRIGGLVTGVANALIEWWSGKDIGDHVYAAMFGPANKNASAAAVAQKKAIPPGAAAGLVANREAPKPRSGNGAIAPSAELAAAARESDAVGRDALRSEIPSMSRAARDSYEKNRSAGEPDESLGVHFPA